MADGVDIFAEAERMAREEADRYDAYLKTPQGQAALARMARERERQQEIIQDEIRQGLRTADGTPIEDLDDDDEEE